MCITRVGRILSIRKNRASVLFFGQKSPRDIDVSLVKAKKNSYVEVFADSALKELTTREAMRRKELWLEVWGREEVREV